MESIQFKPMAGSSTQAKKLDDGSYEVTTKPAYYGATAETTILSEKDFYNKYADRIDFERSPSQDTFSKNNKGA